MKIFAVYAVVQLKIKPSWLDEFRKQYDEPWDLHITLKQPCFIPENKIPVLKKEVSEFFKPLRQTMAISFPKAVIDKDEGGFTVMLIANDAGKLVKLQKSLCLKLSQYHDYFKPEYKSYERDFKPHITIGRNLSERQVLEVKKILSEPFRCEGIIDHVVLSVVNNKSMTFKAGSNPLNHVIYKFIK